MTDIKVTQADREAAEGFHAISEVRNRNSIIEKAFARHRIEVQRPLLEALENMLVWEGRNPPSWVLEKANTAIKQAKGE